MNKNIANNHHLIKVNELNDKTKNSFKVRLISSFFIVLFFLLLGAFSILSDTNWSWFPINNNSVKQVFSYLELALLSVVLVLATIEITNLHFYKNYVMLFIILFSLLITTYVPSLIYIFQKYNYLKNSSIDYFYILIISSLVAYFVIFIINIVFFWIQGLLEFKKIFTHLLLVTMVSTFCSSWLYFASIKGWTTILVLYLITTLTDVFAYIFGMLFGKKKMSPYISPNKTIAGGVGGVMLTTIVIIILFISLSFVPNEYNILGNFFGIKFSYKVDFINVNNIYAQAPWWWISVIFIVIALSIISICGDLSFSYIKRKYSIKDFSNLIPGHGGVLDRIDSLSFVFSSFFLLTLLISFFSSTAGLF